MRRSLGKTIRELLQTFAHPFDSYRPELHYMRGPGPKWHAKRTGSTLAAATVTVDPVHALPEIAKAGA
jgi:hypothetical protein